MSELVERQHEAHGVVSTAAYSPCEQYRYVLTRTWEQPGNMVAFIGLNPSTATEVQDDKTVRRCIGFAKSWGYGSMAMLNIFAYRATDPLVMKKVDDPVGEHNDAFIEKYIGIAELVVACYGSHCMHRGRFRQVKQLLDGKRVHHLGLTKDGHPKHPLYLRANLLPQEWRVR